MFYDQVRGCVGATVTGVHRLQYEIAGTLSEENDGGLELTFDSGQVLFVDAGPDGEALRVESAVWVDPFVSPLSVVNEEFVRTAGKWTKVDVSRSGRLGWLVDRRVTDLSFMIGVGGTTYGLLFDLAGVWLAAYVRYDELRVGVLL